MLSAEQNGIDEALSRPAQFAAGATAWAGGLVLALIAGVHMQSAPAAHASTSPQPVFVESSSAVCHVASDEVTESELDDALEAPATFYPEDTIIAPRPTAGVTEMQTQ
jgi:hypothetical protein